MRHVLTIDLEEWYRNDFPHNNPESWENFDDRVELQVPYLLHLLQKYQQTATFFIVGELAKNHPELIKEIADYGHEIASHGMKHTRVTSLSQKEFQDDLKKSISLLESITQKKVYGFRAPYWSILYKKPEWFYDELAQANIEYSASSMPVSFGLYGDKKLADTVSGHTVGNTLVWEIPVSTVEFNDIKIPVAAGIWLRMLPLRFTQFALNERKKLGEPTMVMIHNWELDPYHPQKKWGMVHTIGHYAGLQNLEKKFIALLKRYKFYSCYEWMRS